jgi:hypothetical protein
MKSGFSTFKNLVWITQLGLSIASPLVVCVVGSVWLSNHFGIGKWLIVVGVIAGIGGAVSALVSSMKSISRSAKTDDEDKPIYFNEHK